MSRSVNVQLVGAFSSQEGSGNPVYIVYDMGKWTRERRQRFTSFANLSECVFIENVDKSRGDVATIDVRIFNPNESMGFAGHPLIGTIYSLHDCLGIDEGILDTGSMKVHFRSKSSPSGRVSELEIPDPASGIYDRSHDLCQIYDLPNSNLPIYDCGPRHVLIRVPDRHSLAAFNPQWEQLKNFDDIALNVYYVDDSHIENRMFSPAYGVYEDRATGSAVIPLLKEVRMDNPSIDTIRVTQGTNRKSGVMMHGKYSPGQRRYSLSGLATSVLKGKCFHE